MIVKEREIPFRIQVLETLNSRLQANHPLKLQIEQELPSRWAGHRGELNLDYHLHFLPEKEFLIFHNLRLTTDEKYYFQIDTLLVSSGVIFIVETKNIGGKLLFEGNFNQFIRTINDKDDGFKDPLTQVKHQRMQLTKWLENHKLPVVPIEYLVVISNPSSIIQTQSISSYDKQRIIHAPLICERVETLSTLYKTEHLDNRITKKLSRLLIKEHTPPTMDVLKVFNLSKSDIITGARCSNCNFIPMERLHGTWVCPSCRFKDKKAHIIALGEYFLLINSSITNKEARKFLHLESKDTASRLLSAMNLPSLGYLKSKTYYLG